MDPSWAKAVAGHANFDQRPDTNAVGNLYGAKYRIQKCNIFADIRIAAAILKPTKDAANIAAVTEKCCPLMLRTTKGTL